MNVRLSNIEVKRQNKMRIFRYLLSVENATKPDISTALQMSTPTVGQIAGELIEAGLVCEAGVQASRGGRRAMALGINGNWRYAAGIDITKNHVDFALINLKGEVVANERLKKPFENKEIYTSQLRELYGRFLDRSQVDRKRIIGKGVSLPGIISKDQKMLERSHILEIREPVMLMETEKLPFPTRFFNDATASCMAECYLNTAPDSFTFFSLRNTVGGANVIENRIVDGENNRSGELGHMCIVPGGRRCYCGELGHYDSYGSALQLSELADGSIEAFFKRLEAGEENLRQAFDEYLDYLAMMIYNIHIVSDLPVMIGGYVGKYLKPYLPLLKDKAERLNIFKEKSEYIYISHYGLEAAAVGAARYQIEQFIETL